MRVAHITATFRPNFTGTGNVAYHNALQLARQGHEVHVFTAAVRGAPAYEFSNQIHIHRLRPLLSYGNALLLPALYDRLRPFDLAHLHLPFYGGSEPVLLLRLRLKNPLVITYHQDVILTGLPEAIRRVHDHLIGRRLMTVADQVCFTSLDYSAHSHYAPLIRAGRLRPVALPNGVDVDRFAPLAAQPEPGNGQTVLFVGALDRAHYFKGLRPLMQAMARLAGDATRLRIVGEGDQRAAYAEMAAKLNLADRVTFAGRLNDEQLAQAYREADVTVLPSTTAGEAFGMVLLESLACATPVVASNLPGVRTVVEEGVDGYLCRPGDVDGLAAALDRLLAMPAERRRRMGQAGRRKVVAHYGWDQIGRQLFAIYEAVLAESRPEQVRAERPVA